jgi:hypothetical protein
MSQKFSHTKETHAMGAMHSRKSRFQAKIGNSCTGVKSSFYRKDLLQPGKILTFVRKLLLILEAAKSGSSYHTKVNYRKFYTDRELGINSTRSTDGFFRFLGMYEFINVQGDGGRERRV